MNSTINFCVFMMTVGLIFYISAHPGETVSKSQQSFINEGFSGQSSSPASTIISPEVYEQLHHAAEAEEKRRKHEEEMKLELEKFLKNQEMEETQNKEIGFFDFSHDGGIDFNF